MKLLRDLIVAEMLKGVSTSAHLSGDFPTEENLFINAMEEELIPEYIEIKAKIAGEREKRRLEMILSGGCCDCD